MGSGGPRGLPAMIAGGVRTGIVLAVTAVAVAAAMLVGSPDRASAQDAPEGAHHAEVATKSVESDVDFVLDLDLGQPAGHASLGPVSGLAALVEHLALGDRDHAVEPGDSGVEVSLLQSRLQAMGFRPGKIDGSYGGQTYSAVLALQKHEGLERTGVVDQSTRAALEGLHAPGQRTDLLGDRIEIDLTRQVIFIVQDSEASIINTSTGNGQPYTSSSGNTAIARTPRGDFQIGTRYNGTQVGYLGSLYRPMYFRGPYAIHGSGSVPAYPASHGCARTSFLDMDYLWTVVPPGLPVYSYD